MPLTPEQRSQRARLAAYAMHSKNDPRDTTAKARATFLSSFETDVDPDGTLAPEERQRRATAARKSHFARLALRSSQVRAERSAR